MDARYRLSSFRASDDPANLAADLQVMVDARLRGKRAEALEREIANVIADLDALGHRMVAHPAEPTTFCGVTDQLDPMSLHVAFGSDEPDEPWSLVHWKRQHPCPMCGAPLQREGSLEIRAVGHGMVGGPKVCFVIEGPTRVELEVGGRDRVAEVGVTLRCGPCRAVLWLGGEVRASPL